MRTFANERKFVKGSQTFDEKPKRKEFKAQLFEERYRVIPTIWERDSGLSSQKNTSNRINKQVYEVEICSTYKKAKKYHINPIQN